jgi:hypothetical protein
MDKFRHEIFTTNVVARMCIDALTLAEQSLITYIRSATRNGQLHILESLYYMINISLDILIASVAVKFHHDISRWLRNQISV